MTDLRPTRLQSLFAGLLKLIGLYGLGFVPLLVFAFVAGMVRLPGLLPVAAVLSLIGVLASLVLMDDKGRPEMVMRPKDLQGAILGFLALGLMTGAILMQVSVTLRLFDIGAFLDHSGISAGLAAQLGAWGEGLDLAGFVTTMALLPIVFGGTLAVCLVLFVRFGETPQRRVPKLPEPEPVAPPSRPRAAEVDSAVMAMRMRMAKRQSQRSLSN